MNKFGYLFLLAIIFLFLSCKENNVNTPDSFKVFSLYDTANVFIEATDIPFKITGKYNNW